MKTILTKKATYAAALLAAASAGMFLASATSANAQVSVAAMAAAQSAPAVSLSSEVFVERKSTSATGVESVSLKKPSEVVVVPGDRIVFKTTYKNNGAEAATGFRATNPMPAPVQFVSVREDWAEVSVDGGATWGKLSALTVSPKAEAGVAAIPASRAAIEADVTHVRWVFIDPIPAGGSGDISYIGIVK
jgi:uncharacterized repeat protein (TIGR01451 family)